MMTAEFQPTLYFKKNCPYCFKVRLFLLEAGILGKVSIVEFEPGTEQEQAIRATLATAFDKVTFPAAQTAPGVFQKDSDGLIDHFAQLHDVALENLSVLKAYVEGPLTSLGNLFSENRDLKAAAAQS